MQEIVEKRTSLLFSCSRIAILSSQDVVVFAIILCSDELFEIDCSRAFASFSSI